MITSKPSKKTIEQWKQTFEEYKNKLTPNKKSSLEVINYIKNKYPTKEITDQEFKDMIISSVVDNNFLKNDNPLHAVALEIQNTDAGMFLYSVQESVFNGENIYFAIETASGYFTSNCGYLYDEICAYSGLDELDLTNFFLVAQYIECLKKFHMYKEVLVDFKRPL